MRRRILIAAASMLGIAASMTINKFGYLPRWSLTPSVELIPCWYYNRLAWPRSDFSQIDMKPIAGTDAPNTGLAVRNDTLVVVCGLPDNRGTAWILVINLAGRAGQQYTHTVGFVPQWAVTLNSQGPILECGAT